MSETTINISIFGGKCFLFLSGEEGWWKRGESKLELDEKRASGCLPIMKDEIP